MTEFDKKLIEKARKFRCWDYRDIDILISIAETKEGRQQLADIKYLLYGQRQETL